MDFGLEKHLGKQRVILRLKETGWVMQMEKRMEIQMD
jgi:hypothetical protein